MFGKRLHLFDLFGFSVYVDLSWLIIAVLIVWSLAGGAFPMWYEGHSNLAYLLMGVGGAVGIFVSIVWHELCHSLIARRFGLPMKGITLFIFGGVAEMEDEPVSPKAEFLMAIAGPFSSVALAAVAFGIARGGAGIGWPETVTGVFSWLALINMVLAIFNMIPGFPLDGGRALRAVLWQVKGDLRWATRSAARVGGAFGLVLIGLGVVNLFLGGNPIGGVWWILIGLFLRNAAQMGYQQVLTRRALEGEPVGRFMTREVVTVPPDLPLDRFVEDYVYRYHHKMYPVLDQDELKGCVHLNQVKDVDRATWGQHTVGDVVHPCAPENSLAPDADALDALRKMRGQPSARLMVVEEGRLVGVLTLKDLLAFLSLKLELDEGEGREAAEAVLPAAGEGEERS